MFHGTAGKYGRLVALLMGLVALLSACSPNYSSAYQKAVDLFAAGEYDEASRAFDRLGDYQQSAVYAAYSHGLVYYEKGDYATAEPYFEKAQDFMYGKTRYVYCHAYVMEQAGSYAEAAELYASLGEFETAPQAASYCKSRLAEVDKDYETALYAYEAAGEYADAPTRLEELQFLVYEQANTLKLKATWLVNNTTVMAQSRAVQAEEEAARASDGHAATPHMFSTLDEDFTKQATGLSDGQKVEAAVQYYRDALYYYTLLGDYYNSPAESVEVKGFLRDQMYVHAENLERDGRLQEAYEAFAGLIGYSDAETRAEELAAKLGIKLDTELDKE